MSIFQNLKKLNEIEKRILKRLENGENFELPIWQKPYIDSIIRKAINPLKGKIIYKI